MMIGCPQNSAEEFTIGKHMTLRRLTEVIESTNWWAASRTAEGGARERTVAEHIADLLRPSDSRARNILLAKVEQLLAAPSSEGEKGQ